MPSTLALLSSDAHLLRCQIALLEKDLPPLQTTAPAEAVGLGYFEADNILLRKKPAALGASRLTALTSDVISEVLFFHSGPVGKGSFADDDAMPLRQRRWLFAHHGEFAAPESTRRALVEALPDYLALQLKGTTAGEACFFTFLKLLRDGGRMDDFDLLPELAGEVLGACARRAESADRRAGGAAGSLTLFATNGRVLAATRLGAGPPLRYALLEGISRCERCQIAEDTPESNPLLRAHRRVRGVVVSSGCQEGSAFLEVPEGSFIAVGQRLEIRIGAVPALRG